MYIGLLCEVLQSLYKEN